MVSSPMNSATVVLLAVLVLAVVWSTWNTNRYFSSAHDRLMDLHEETVRQLYVLKAGEVPERAQELGRLDLMTREDPDARPPVPPVRTHWQDDDVLARE